jgi:MoaA/NifB/PqqE/SkfB family radical SAM enzyme
MMKNIINNRDVYIYAVNLEGMGMCKLFSRLGYKVRGFIDSRKFNKQTKFNLPIIDPDEFFDEYNHDKFIVIATKHRNTKKMILEMFESRDIKKDIDFIIATELTDYLPTIEVVGSCNLQCISCEMGLPQATNKGFMSVENYKKVLSKMTQEIPFMNSVCLYLWGEPFMHPNLPEIIKITSDLGIATDISTNLNYAKHLDEIIKANPDMLTVPCSGIGNNYEITHTKGKWEIFEQNLYKLRESIDKYDVDIPVRLVYHMYKHNLEEDYDYVEHLAKKLNFFFFPVLANIFPGKVYDYAVDDKPLPEQMIEANKMMIVPIDEQLEKAYENRDKPCPVWKAFPTVRSDNTVLNCCNMVYELEGYNYLDTPLETLIKARNESELCKKCISKGVHRFFDINAKVEDINGKRVIKRF